jgi:radical SAM-linked protein
LAGRERLYRASRVEIRFTIPLGVPEKQAAIPASCGAAERLHSGVRGVTGPKGLALGAGRAEDGASLEGQPTHRPAPLQQKVEFRFEKGEAVRFISHHDLMRAFQRAVRRAKLPVRLTEGFNPRPRIVFPVALEVGIAALDEVAELELTEWIQPNELLERLETNLPPGLHLLTVKELPPTRRSRMPVRLRYRVHLTEANIQLDEARLTALLATPTLPFKKQKPGKAVQTRDLKASLVHVALDAGDLVVEVKPSPQGLARPLEFLSLLLETPLEQLRHIRVTREQMELAEPPLPPQQNQPLPKA